jgi:hypothetical protein
MLQDPRSINLVTGFFEPKFNIDNLIKSKPDPAEFPNFDLALLQAMGMETRMFLDSQLREDHGALELWTANYSFLNDRLARHYGVPNVPGSDFRRVTCLATIDLVSSLRAVYLLLHRNPLEPRQSPEEYGFSKIFSV